MNKFLLLTAVAFISGCSSILAPSDWLTDAKTGCKVFNFNPQPNEAIEYSGNCVDGFAEGVGTVIWKRDGAIFEKYEGTFKKGKSYGQGTLTYKSGNRYEGEIKDGNRNGYGVWTFVTGEKYVGEFKDGKISGGGITTFPNGNRYIGEYKDNKLSGQGTLTFADRSRYVGDFINGQQNGQGTLYSPSGAILTQGRWVEGNFIHSPKPENSTSAELEKLRLDNEEAKIKQIELEAQLKLSQQQFAQSSIQFGSQAFEGKRIALVIGNANYKNSPLRNPINDAEDVSCPTSACVRQIGLLD